MREMRRFEGFSGSLSRPPASLGSGCVVVPQPITKQTRWVRSAQKLLGQIEKLVELLRKIDPENVEVLQKLALEADYFERNAQLMRYPEFRKKGLCLGSGVIEARCKTVIGSRLKCSGMFWPVRGANGIIALRCCFLNGRFENTRRGVDFSENLSPLIA
jgi:hypothetical protein